MKLSTRSRYSARILLELARNSGKEPLQVSEISKRQEIPAKYIEQLIRTLKRAQLVGSSRGPKGGHFLAKDPQQISLGDVVRLFETQSDLVACISTPEKCPMAEACRVRLVWQEATAALFDKLDAVSIADLICAPQELE